MPTFPELANEAASYVFHGLLEAALRTFYTSTINYDPFEDWTPLLAKFPILRPVLYAFLVAGIFPTFLFALATVYIFFAHLFVGDLIHDATNSVARRPIVRNTVWIASKLLPKSFLSR